jgi:hypothetical protein
MDAAGVHLKSVVADKLFRWGPFLLDGPINGDE